MAIHSKKPSGIQIKTTHAHLDCWRAPTGDDTPVTGRTGEVVLSAVASVEGAVLRVESCAVRVRGRELEGVLFSNNTQISTVG